MTQEEKQKRYDEALEELRGLLKCIREEKREILEEDITSIFPELQENEDERIRKDIVEAVEFHKDFSQKRKEYIYAWLEKQGEQKPQDKSALEAINEEKVDNANKIEQKPTEWSEKYIADVFEKVGLAKIVREQSNDALTIALQDAMIELSKFIPQSNHAWSEEDEYCRHQLIVFCENCMVQDDGAKRCAHWLKSIKDRVKTQQEWTMQDEEELQIALDTLVKAGQHSSAKWLKNVCLVPQNKWKPSDEQMKVLEAMLTVSPQSPTMTSTLIELYEDLKKLRVE